MKKPLKHKLPVKRDMTQGGKIANGKISLVGRGKKVGNYQTRKLVSNVDIAVQLF